MTILIPAHEVARMTDDPRPKRTDPTPLQVSNAEHNWNDLILRGWRYGRVPITLRGAPYSASTLVLPRHFGASDAH